MPILGFTAFMSGWFFRIHFRRTGVWLGLFERMKRSDTKVEAREARHMFQGRGGGEETSEGAERLTDEV